MAPLLLRVTCRKGVSWRARILATTALTSRDASPSPRYSASVHTASDLAPARRMQSFAGHGDEDVASADPDVRAHLDRSRQEWPRPGPAHQVQHLRDVGVSEDYSFLVRAAFDPQIDHLHAGDSAHDLPTSSRDGWPACQCRNRTRPHQGGQVIPRPHVVVRRQRPKRTDPGRVTHGLSFFLGEKSVRPQERAPHR